LGAAEDVLFRPDTVCLRLLEMGPIPRAMHQRKPNWGDMRAEVGFLNLRRKQGLQGMHTNGDEAAPGREDDGRSGEMEARREPPGNGRENRS